MKKFTSYYKICVSMLTILTLERFSYFYSIIETIFFRESDTGRQVQLTLLYCSKGNRFNHFDFGVGFQSYGLSFFIL